MVKINKLQINELNLNVFIHKFQVKAINTIHSLLWGKTPFLNPQKNGETDDETTMC